MTPAYFRLTSPTYLENWPAALQALSLPHTPLPLEFADVEAVLDLAAGVDVDAAAVDGFRLAPLRSRLDDAIRDLGGGAFVRLGSRSAKDSPLALARGLKVRDGGEALTMLAGSRRVRDDLRLARRFGHRPHVFVRNWVDLAAWAEFRCFMRARRLVGVSQYVSAGTAAYGEIAEGAAAIEAAIRRVFDRFRDACHLDDVVFDVFVAPARDGAGLEARLLDLNPFAVKTDPCLFHWQGPDDFDGSFRYLPSPRP